MPSVEQALREALAEAGRGQVTFRRDFQGFPGTAHGGAVAALFYRVTTPRPPVRLRMALLRGVPTETALRLTTGSRGTAAHLALAHEDRPLAEAELTRGDVAALDTGPLLAAWERRDPAAAELPGTATCLACGSANPLGVGIRFLADTRLLWRQCTPPESYRAADRSLHPAFATVVLDELGWWLGALAQQECGVTTEVTVTVLRHLPFGPLLVLGDRAAVRPEEEDPRGRYVRASGVLLTADGEPLAACAVRFAGSAAYTRRLLRPFLETTEPERLFRLFPNARGLGGREDGAGARPT